MSTDHISTHPDSPLHGNGIGSEAINLAAIRQEYTKGGLKEGDLPDNPLSLFNRWLHEAIDAQVDEPTGHAGRHRISRRATIDPYRTAKGSA